MVVGLAESSEIAADRLLAPLRAVGPGVPDDLVALASWIAAEYCSTPARALSLMLPPGTAGGTRALTRLVAELTPAGAAALATPSVRLTSTQRTALERLREAGRLTAAETGLDHGGLRRLADRGLVSIERRVVGRRPEHLPVGARRSARSSSIRPRRRRSRPSGRGWAQPSTRASCCTG